MIAQTEHELTGYPSVDKPWLKYYDKALIEEDIPKCSAFRMLYERNKDYLTDTALLHIAKLNGRVCGAKRPHSVFEQSICYLPV